MSRQLDHEDAMELAVQLACSYLTAAGGGTTNAEDLILDYYQQIRRVEQRLDSAHAGEEELQEFPEEELEEEASMAI